MRVVITNPVHQHAYETVVAAQRGDALERFVTGFYRRGTRRSHPAIATDKVTSLPFYDGISVAAARLPGLSRTGHLGWMARRFDFAAARRLSRWPSDVVHAYEDAALHTLAVARGAGRLAVLDVPSAHERFAEAARLEGDTRSRFATERVRAERKGADLILAPSAFVAACLADNGVPSERVALVPYGADPSAIRPADPGAGALHVVFVGRVGPRKGVRYLLEAWRRLSLPGARLTLAGRVEDRALVRDLPPGARWAGHLSPGRVADLLSASNAFAFPSLAEGSALVTYEAMAAGLPSVVTAESGSQVRDGLDGYVVPRRDPDSVAERLQVLAADPSLRVRMGASARARIETGFTWRHYQERVAAAWRAALS